MTKKTFILALSLFALIFMNACVSFSSHQTAEVLKEDQVEWGEGIGYLMFDYDIDTTDANGNKTTKHESTSVPYFPETIFRFGIDNNMDVGIKVAGVIANIEVDLKYQVLQIGDKTSNTTISVQPSASGMVMGDFKMYKFGMGLLASQRISERMAFYGNLKYNYLAVSISDSSNDGDGASDAFADGNLYTAAVGFSYEGKSFWVRPEATIVLNKDFKKLLILPAMGFGLRF